MFSQMCVKNSVQGGHAWQGGMHGRGGGMRGRQRAWQGVCVEGETATAEDGTHPTGMHSCLSCLSFLV